MKSSKNDPDTVQGMTMTELYEKVELVRKSVKAIMAPVSTLTRFTVSLGGSGVPYHHITLNLQVDVSKSIGAPD